MLAILALMTLGPRLPIHKGLLEGVYPALAVELEPDFWVALDTNRGGLLRMWRGEIKRTRNQHGKSVLTSVGPALLTALDNESIWAVRINDIGAKLTPRIIGVVATRGRLSVWYEAHLKKPPFRIHELIETRVRHGKVFGFDRTIAASLGRKDSFLHFIAPEGIDWALENMFWTDYTESLHLIGMRSSWRGRASGVFIK